MDYCHLALGLWVISVEVGSGTAPQIRKGCIRNPLWKEHRNWLVGPQNRRQRARGQLATV